MKSLQNILTEGLFDNDIFDKDIEFGSLYEMSDTTNYNMVTNDLMQLLRCFNKKELAQQAEKTKNKVNKNNGFIEYWSFAKSALQNLINVILGMPAYLITTDEKTNNRSISRCKVAEKNVKSYMDKFSGRPRDWDVVILKNPDKNLYVIEFIEGIFSTQPNRIKLTFIGK